MFQKILLRLSVWIGYENGVTSTPTCVNPHASKSQFMAGEKCILKYSTHSKVCAGVT